MGELKVISPSGSGNAPVESVKRHGAHYYRIVCLSGEMRGKAYPLTRERVVIGRGDNSHIVIHDQKSSREHAEIVKVKDKFILSDLKSQNGIFVNGKKTKQHTLINLDKFSVGETVFQFRIPQVESLAKHKTQAGNSKRKKKQSPVRTIAIIGIALLVILWLIEDQQTPESKMLASKEQSSQQSPTPSASDLTEISSELLSQIEKRRISENKELSRQTSVIIMRGLRELREGNYFRAMSEFTHALDVNPKDPQANFYLRKAQDDLNELVKTYNMNAVRDIEALQYQKAVVSYCAIIRLLHNYEDDNRYKAAEANIRKIEEALGYNRGEIECIQKQ